MFKSIILNNCVLSLYNIKAAMKARYKLGIAAKYLQQLFLHSEKQSTLPFSFTRKRPSVFCAMQDMWKENLRGKPMCLMLNISYQKCHGVDNTHTHRHGICILCPYKLLLFTDWVICYHDRRYYKP